MLPLPHLLAALLLTAPADPATPDPALMPALRAVALDWELLDPRETPYVLGRPVDLAGDLALLRDRCRELRTAPRLADAARWPARKLVNDLLADNRAYRRELVARLALDTIHEEELRDAIAETDQLYRVWAAVRDTRCDFFYYVHVRRQALLQLRALIGDAAYFRGELPPHLPLWRLPRLP